MVRFELTANDGCRLAATRFDPPGRAKSCIVIAPAMAIPQAYYAVFATWLAGQGHAVLTFDYRGTGESLQGSMRGAAGDLDDWLCKDYDAALRAAAAMHPGAPLFALGHSFGGQCAPLLPSRALLSGLVNVAVGSGAMRYNTPAYRWTTPLLWYLLVPVLCPLFGYYPGARLGILGDIPNGAMWQWRRWCLSHDYLLSAAPGARGAYASAGFPVLGLTIGDDELLSEEGSRVLHDAYPRDKVDYRVIEPAQYRLKRIGHSGFFRPQGQAALWPLVTEWIAATTAAQTGQTQSSGASR